MKAPHSVDSLRKISERIAGTAKKLMEMAADMEAMEMAEIRPNYHKEMLRGIAGIEDFTGSIGKELRDAAMDRGAFQATASPAKARGKAARRK